MSKLKGNMIARVVSVPGPRPGDQYKPKDKKKVFTAVRCITSEGSLATFNPDKPMRMKRLFTEYPAYERWFVEESGAFDEPQPPVVTTRKGRIVSATRAAKIHKKRMEIAKKLVKRQLNMELFARFADMQVPLERMTLDKFHRHTFERFQGPLSMMFDTVADKNKDELVSTLYLAQYPLSDLPQELRDDLPPPEVLKVMGKGDVYASSLWMGGRSSQTPLHRDPNPNLLLHLCGKKIVRLVTPSVGQQIYERVRAKLGLPGGSPNIRGEEMMQGKEMAALDAEIWKESGIADSTTGLEVTLKKGDGLYIPAGWWHSVKNAAKGTNVSVNWWFR